MKENTPNEVLVAQLRHLADTTGGRIAKRVAVAAAIAEEAGLSGRVLRRFNAKELFQYFEDEGAARVPEADLAVTISTAAFILKELIEPGELLGQRVCVSYKSLLLWLL